MKTPVWFKAFWLTLGTCALVFAVLFTLRSLLDSGDDAPAPTSTTPAVSSDPHGSVVTYEVNGRTVACAVIDPPGEAVAMSCDWTREATK